MSLPHVSAVAHPVAMALAGEAPRVARRIAETILLIYMVFLMFTFYLGKYYDCLFIESESG